MKHFAIIMIFLTAALSGCGLHVQDVEWTEVRECTSDELAFIDHSIEELELVDQVDGNDLDNEHFTLKQNTDRLRQAQNENNFRCGIAELSIETENVGDEIIISQANWQNGEIRINTESMYWTTAFPRWNSSREYWKLNNEDKIEILSHGNWEYLRLLQDLASNFIYEPSPIAGNLAHEAGHLLTGFHHDFDAEDIDTQGDDVMSDWLAEYGYDCDDAVFTKLYIPEHNWLEETYQNHNP